MKEFLISKNYSIRDLRLDFDPVLKEKFINSGFTTVPQVFIDGKRIGGYEATVAYIEGDINHEVTSQ